MSSLFTKVVVRDFGRRQIQVVAWDEVAKPFFSSISLLLRESQLDELFFFLAHDLEALHMGIKVLEVNLGVRNVASTQSLEVLVVPSFLVLVLLLPFLILWHREKAFKALGILWVTLPDLDDRSDELQKEPWHLEQARELTLEKVDK